MKTGSLVHSTGIAALAITAAVSFGAVPASAAAQTGPITPGTPFDLGPSPTGLPSTCSFPNGDANFVFGAGSFVSHDSQNKNGDWGGETLQGPAVFYEDATPIAQGHLTIWFGGGNNARGQNEGGATINYTGSGASGSVAIHVNVHSTVNVQAQPTANILNVNITCG